MAKVEYIITDLLALATRINYQPELAEAVNDLLNADNEIEYKLAQENATSLIAANREFGGELSSQFGLPIFMPLLFEAYEPEGEELLLESAVVEPSSSKKIVMTDLQGRDGSVKEFINNGDYSVTVSGIMCNRRIGYPIEQVEVFKNFMHQKQSLSVVHELLNLLGIHQVVITDWKLPKTPFINCQPYEFTCIQDTPIELTIQE